MKYDEETKVKVPKIDGQVGIRATLNNMGIKNSSIGFDEKTETVTLNGKPLIKAGYYDSDAGVTYAPLKQIQKSVTDFYKSSGNPVVKVSDAFSSIAGKYGLSADALGYSNGTVTIGGKPVDIMYIDDSGKAWAKEDSVADAVDGYINSVGAKSPNEILKSYDRKYLPQIEELTDRIVNREEFSYDPENDPVYKAYRDKYYREGERATQEAMASYSTLTGGYANSMAVTAGALAQQEYMKKATDAIPEFAKLAYSRYVEKYNQDLKAVDSLLEQYNAAYKNAVEANNQMIANANASALSNVNRDDAAFNRNWQDRINTTDEYWKNSNNEFDRTWAEIFNQQQREQNDLNYSTDSLEREQIRRYLENYFDPMAKGELTSLNLKNQKLERELWK